jgi:carbon monoxide dehydrogenase subunit G
MTVFNSSVQINKPVNVVFNFLADLNNHRLLMPDSISDWSSTSNEARFTIQNMLKLVLKIGDKIENKQITIIPAEKPPFDLSQTWDLLEENGQTVVTLTTAAELNMMMKMMASAPLQKLVDFETITLQNHFV